VREHEPILTERHHGAVDLLDRRHARRHHDRNAERAHALEQRQVRDARRRDLDPRPIPSAQHLDALGIPDACGPVDPEPRAVRVDELEHVVVGLAREHVLAAQLERRARRIMRRPRHVVVSIEAVERLQLKLDAVRARRRGLVDHADQARGVVGSIARDDEVRAELRDKVRRHVRGDGARAKVRDHARPLTADLAARHASASAKSSS